jgi:hypothetical protein
VIKRRWYDTIVLVFDYIKVLTNGQIQFLDSLSVNYLLISPCRDPCTVSWAHNVVHGFWICILFLFHEYFSKYQSIEILQNFSWIVQSLQITRLMHFEYFHNPHFLQKLLLFSWFGIFLIRGLGLSLNYWVCRCCF